MTTKADDDAPERPDPLDDDDNVRKLLEMIAYHGREERIWGPGPVPMEPPDPAPDSKLTDEQLAHVAGAMPMIGRLSRVMAQRATESADATPASPPPVLGAARRHLVASMLGLADRVAWRMFRQTRLSPLTRHVELAELRWRARSILVRYTVSFDLQQIDDYPVLAWRTVKMTMDHLITEDAVRTAMTIFGERLSNDFAQADYETDHEDWETYTRAAWGFTAAYLVGVYGAMSRLEGKRRIMAEKMTTELGELIMGRLAELDPGDRELLASRGTGVEFAKLAKARGESEVEARLAFHRAAMRLGDLLQPPPRADEMVG